jgi:formylglycine-generating enzyme required for sulfatase activity
MLDVGMDEETGIDYIVQEYVGGGAVSDLMKKGVLEEGYALDIVISVASALAAAAEFNIIHRDIKPENIMLTERGEVKLADLGIAKECNGQDGDLTISQVMMGTPSYVAPEQARNTKRVDARADIYSLGATLYHMLCGQPPYPGETTFEVLSNLIAEPVPNPRQKRPDLSPAVAALVMRMIAKDPAHRPATAALLVEELKAARRTVAAPRHPLFRKWPELRAILLDECRKQWHWLAAGAGLLAVAVGLWIGLGGHHAPASVPPPRRPSPVVAGGPRLASPLLVPQGCKALPGTTAEPYTRTQWAKEIVDESTGIELVYVPAGEFRMGSPVKEAGREENETQHKVRLTQGFYLGKYEITQAQWEEVTGHNPSKCKTTGSDAPVETISWYACQDFCEKAGHGIRLPTEAEWEYACRAGTSGAYGGSGNLDQMGWYLGNSGGLIHPVGKKTANAWGLYDMHGNVFEWCQDWWGDYPAKDAVDPVCQVPGTFRCSRGGAANSPDPVCRSASRFNMSESITCSSSLGMRVAISLPANPQKP